MSETSQAHSGCDQCNRSGLSLLLLRPSPIARDRRIAPLGAESVSADENSLLAGLVPSGTKATRYALRLLRPGYVHMYIPKPPAGVAHWHVYRVTGNADLIAQTDPVFVQMPRPAPCSRSGHNALGMRLLPIPQAHLIETVWIAYSANLWNDRLRQQNQANPQVMQEIHVKQGVGNAGSFQPTAEALKRQVLECALPALTIDGSREHDFPFCSLMTQTEPLAEEMQSVAARHPQTEGRQLAVVLRDPVGIAAELNALRLRMSELATSHLLKPEVVQPLEVNKLILTLKQSVLPAVDAEKTLTAVTRLVMKSAYERDKAKLPPGTEFEELTIAERQEVLSAKRPNNPISQLAAGSVRARVGTDPLGRLIYPDHEERVRKWAQEQADKAWERFADYYDDEQRRQWLQSLRETLQAQYLNALQDCEDDWSLALRANPLKDYFKDHFDENDANTQQEFARTGCSAGGAYMEEAALCFAPEPLCPGSRAQAIFEEQLDADIATPDAIMLRAMVGNQKSLIEILVTDERGKTYDFIKGLIGEYTGTKAHLGQQLTPRMSQLVSWLSNVNMGYSLGIVGALGAAATNAVASDFEKIISVANAATQSPGLPAPPAAISPQMLARLTRVEAMALVHQASEQTLKAALNNTAVAVPVVVMTNLSPAQVRQMMISRGAPMSRRAVRALGKHQVRVAMVVDSKALSDLMAAPQDDLRASLGKHADNVVLAEQAYSYQKVATATNGQVLTLPMTRVSQLYLEHQARISQAPGLVQSWMSEMQASAQAAGQRVQGMAAVHASRRTLVTIEGRLAIGSTILQVVMLMKGVESYQKEMAKSTPDERKRTDALINMSGAMAGAMGGMAELSAVYWSYRTQVKHGLSAQAVQARPSVLLLRGLGYTLGAVGSFMAAWSSWRMADDLKDKGRGDLFLPMRWSGFFFAVGGAPLILLAMDALLKYAISKGLLSAANPAARYVARAAGARIGAGIAARLGVAAAGLSVPGVGWVLTGVAIGEFFYVVTNIHDPLQTWLAGSYFGKTAWYQSSIPKRSSWEEELAAFNSIDWGEPEETATEEETSAEKVSQ